MFFPYWVSMLELWYLHAFEGASFPSFINSAMSLNPPTVQFPWRNGWFYAITQRETKEGRPDPFPQHTQLLQEVKAI